MDVRDTRCYLSLFVGRVGEWRSTVTAGFSALPGVLGILPP